MRPTKLAAKLTDGRPRCRAWLKSAGPWRHQCTSAAAYDNDLHCRRHSATTIKAKRERRNAELQAEMDRLSRATDRKHRREIAFNDAVIALRAIADGHRTPRIIAKAALLSLNAAETD